MRLWVEDTQYKFTGCSLLLIVQEIKGNEN